MIKCRGETKCVPTWNICDSRSDCLLNQDDEATCYKCPEYCKCNSYYIECMLYEIIPWRTKKIMKVISTKETFDFAFLEDNLHLFYLDISTSNTRNLIDNSNKQNQDIAHLFLFNGSANLLSEIHVMIQSYFQSIQIIDLSNKRLFHFVNIPPKLKIVYLKSNLLVLIGHQNFLNKHSLLH